MYFDQAGKENTQQVAAIVAEYCKQHKIGHIVVASVSGNTAALFLGKVPDARIIDVTHVYGSREDGVNLMSDEKRSELESKGIRLVTATHVLSGIERSFSSQFGGVYPTEIVANTLRMFGDGVKVAVECATMALDNGAIPYGEDVIAVGGSRGGADTAILIRPAHASKLLEARIKEIICKPRS